MWSWKGYVKPIVCTFLSVGMTHYRQRGDASEKLRKFVYDGSFCCCSYELMFNWKNFKSQRKFCFPLWLLCGWNTECLKEEGTCFLTWNGEKRSRCPSWWTMNTNGNGQCELVSYLNISSTKKKEYLHLNRALMIATEDSKLGKSPWGRIDRARFNLNDRLHLKLRYHQETCLAYWNIEFYFFFRKREMGGEMREVNKWRKG